MADFGIYTKNADILARCGANANVTAKATAATDIYVLDVEAFINTATRYNWSDAVTAGLNADVEGILTDTSASICAIYVIQWDMSGYTTRISAENMVNILRDNVLRNLSILRDKKTQKFIREA